MENAAKLKLLGAAARWDASAPSTVATREPLPAGSSAVYEAIGVDGRRMRILKVLLSNACSYDCLFCPMRVSRSQQRASFRPEELARLASEMRQAGLIEGMMLSSGIVGDPDSTMERMIETARLLRHQFGFRDHLHLKLMPGVAEAAIISAAEVADRLSLNLEAPAPELLSPICPAKDFTRQVMRPLRQAAAMVAPGRLSAGVTTQFVVGAARETDRQLTDLTWELLSQTGLRRVHFYAFEPIPDTPMADAEPASIAREQRLSQVELLLRAYGFEPAEIVFDEGGMLPLETDPKLASAEARQELFPIEVNSAEKWELLRVPGIGPTVVEGLIFAREQVRLKSLRQLTTLGVRVDRARNYLTLSGRFYPRRPPAQQLSMEM